MRLQAGRRRYWASALLVAAALICQAVPAVGQARLETAAPRAILIDLTTKSTLFEKNADDLTPPASLAKLMSVEVAFDQIRKGQLSLDDEFTVSEQAAGFATGSVLSLVVAEGIAGSVPKFVALMNERAKAVGLTKSRFTNPHGLPDAGQRVTMREMALLAAHLIWDTRNTTPCLARRSSCSEAPPGATATLSWVRKAAVMA